jgi:UDP-glucose-4-epimerase GalE
LKETVLVTGGAGYVGSHACKAVAAAGYVPVVYDDLSTGHADLVQWGELEVGNILDAKRLDAVLDQHKPAAVLHFAALSIVGESVSKPELYHRNNVEGSRCLLQAMAHHNIASIVFSSTAAVYGTPDQVPITEDMPKQPINPYGETKAEVEDDLARSGLSWTALRYFNASGADADGQTGEHHTPETHLIPLVLDVALGRREEISIFGDDYETPDGTCLRDYIHVTDLANAHVRALARLLGGGESGPFNLGTGIGTSVNEIIEAARVVTGHAIPTVTGKRRAGDPPVLVCSNAAASQALDWRPSRGIETQIADAWRWHKARFG